MECTFEPNEFVASANDINKVRLVDINTEILKGRTIKPGILHEDTIDLTDDTTETVQQPPPKTSTPCTSKDNSSIFNQNFLQTMRKVIQTPVTNAPNSQQQSTLSLVLPAKNTVALPQNNVGQNTIIGLPDHVYLVPVKYFNSNNTFLIPPNNKFHYVETAVGTSMLKPIVAVAAPMAPAPVAKAVPKPKVVEKPKIEEELRHPCFKPKKHRKVDWEGLSAADPMGFYKSEIRRVNKCHKILSQLTWKAKKELEALEKEIAVKFGKNNYYKKFKLKDCRIVLNKNEVTEYFSEHGNFEKKVRKYEYRKAAAELSFEMESEVCLPRINFTRPVYVVNHYNFGTIDYETTKDTIIFVNTNNTVTEMCLDSFPSFKKAVQCGAVKVVNERLLEIFLKRFKQMCRSSDVILDYSVDNESNNVKQLCMSQKKVMFQLAPDHIYSLSPGEETQSLLMVVGSQPFNV